MKFSVVVPCYNQGRFLTDCLESLACQETPPWEVIVVDDGSTEEETIELCRRLPHYHYPFPLRRLRKPNGGLPSARNHGIRRCGGDIILPLDADDKLTPDAIGEFTGFFARNADVDICYPDIIHFGNDDSVALAPPLNRWRLTQGNHMVCCSAIRRRVFEAGYWYDEEMRRGFEDWEFWIRTCALGPFRATPLGKTVFLYRRLGYSMIAAVNHQQVVSFFWAKHKAQGLWSEEVEQRLRTAEAPTHRVVCGDQAQASLPGHDISSLPEGSLDQFLKTDQVSRFVWFGSFPREATPHLQLLVNEVARFAPAPAYLFIDSRTSSVYLAVLDRLAALGGAVSNLSSPTPFRHVRTVTTTGDGQPRLLAIGQRNHPVLQSVEALAPLGNLQGAKALPAGCGADARVDANISYYLHREPAVPCPVVRTGGGRVLAVAMPSLTCGGSGFAVRILLEEGAVRSRFDKIFILTFDKDEHPAHSLFEPLADAIHHLGNLPGDDERKMEIALAMLESSGATDFLVVNSRHGFGLIPRIRKAGLALRISAQLHGLDCHPLTGVASEGYPRDLASRYAALVDRVASISDYCTSFMVDQLYFPRHKVKTVRLGVDQRRFRPATNGDSRRPKRVVWCGRLSAEKDPLLALRVAEHFHRQAPDVRFLFVGEGPEASNFSAQLRACKARGVPAEWVPRSHQVDQILRESDCLLMTSLWEGIPIVALEALSTGVPVVMCFTNTALREIANPGQCFEVANRLDLANYCRRLHEALAAPRFTPDPALSHHRYAREMIDWLFPAGAGARQDYLTAVFGANPAA